MKLHEILALDTLATAQVVTVGDNLARNVVWMHIVDLPDVREWVRPGIFLLTTGYAWPHSEPEQREMIRSLASLDLACIGLAVPNYFEHFPLAIIDESQHIQLPLIEIPWNIPFVQITETVHRAILNEQYHVIEQSEEIHRTLTRAALDANSLQDLATTLGKLINRAITIEDPQGHMLAEYSLSSDEDTLRRATLLNGETPSEFVQYLERIGFYQSILHTKHPIRIPALKRYDLHARIVYPIRLKEELVGMVWIIEGDRPLSELDERASEHAAIVAALQIAHQRALTSFEERLGYTFLDSLLEGHFDPTHAAMERARLLGFDRDARYRVGVLVLDESIPLSSEGFLRRERIASLLRQQLRLQGYTPLISLSLNKISFLLPDHTSADRIWHSFVSGGISMAVGQQYQGVDGIQQSYQEVLSILTYLPSNSFYEYESLLLPRVLLGDQIAQEAFLDQILGTIRRQRNGDVLLETLLAWTNAGFHYPSVAEHLHVHMKTLHYRLTRIANLTGLDLANTEIRFQLQLATHLLSLKEKRFL